jgi:hypothetical protein
MTHTIRASRTLPENAKGLRVSVYRPADSDHDCTLNGISSNHPQLTLVGIIDDRDAATWNTPAPAKELPRDCRVSAPTDEAPAAILRIRRMGPRLVYSIEPYQADGGVRWYMAGGNYAGSCDSRFSELAGNQYAALSIHDRHEG